MRFEKKYKSQNLLYFVSSCSQHVKFMEIYKNIAKISCLYYLLTGYDNFGFKNSSGVKYFRNLSNIMRHIIREEITENSLS